MSEQLISYNAGTLNIGAITATVPTRIPNGSKVTIAADTQVDPRLPVVLDPGGYLQLDGYWGA